VILLDENTPPHQRHRLLKWHMPVRQSGYDIARKGIQDEEIIPFLRTLRRPTFITLDAGFYKREFCHARYGLAFMAVKQPEVATFVRRLLGHPEFDTQAKRMGAVMRVSHVNLSVWRLNSQKEIICEWTG
jgi:hypothetical protein